MTYIARIKEDINTIMKDEPEWSYDEILETLLITFWKDSENPMDLLNEDISLREEFDNLYAKKKTSLKGISNEIWRGTDYINLFKSITVDDIIDLTDRYTSWSTDRLISTWFIDKSYPIILGINVEDHVDCLDCLDLSKMDREKEVVLRPSKYKVISIEELANGKFIQLKCI